MARKKLPVKDKLPEGAIIPTFAENAITVLERRYLKKDDQGKAIEKPEDILNNLINLYSLGLTFPLKFMPKSAYVFTRNLLKKGDRFKAQKVAQKELDGNSYMGMSGEASDWYFKTVFKNKYVMDKEFEDNAIKIFEPLIAHKQ